MNLLFLFTVITSFFIHGSFCTTTSFIEDTTIPDKIKVYVINMKHRTDRWENFNKFWPKYELFDFIQYEGVAIELNGACGLTMTHIKLLELFMNSKEDFLMVMEDDAVPVEDFDPDFIQKSLEKAMKLPYWHVLNFAPWFTRQPRVEKIDEHLVSIDYFHTTHMMVYHRRAAESFLHQLKNILATEDCPAIDNYLGSYRGSISKALLLATTRSQAVQNLGRDSDVGGGPEITLCAVNAALAGRLVSIKVNVDPDPYQKPTFDAPLYGYYGGDGGLTWAERCNLDTDDASVLVDYVGDKKGKEKKGDKRKKKGKKRKGKKKRGNKRVKSEL